MNQLSFMVLAFFLRSLPMSLPIYIQVQNPILFHRGYPTRILQWQFHQGQYHQFLPLHIQPYCSSFEWEKAISQRKQCRQICPACRIYQTLLSLPRKYKINACLVQNLSNIQIKNLFDLKHILTCRFLCPFRSLAQHLSHPIIRPLAHILLNNSKALNDDTTQIFLEFLHISTAIRILLNYIFDFSVSEGRIEFKKIGKSLPILWIKGDNIPMRIRHCSSYLLSHFLLIIGKIYPRSLVRLTLRHLFLRIHQGHYLREFRLDVFNLREEFCFKLLVESFSVFVGKLDMLKLVYSDRYMIGLVEKDINCHKNGVSIQSNTTIFMAFLFELDHGVQPVLRSKTAKDPGEFAVLRDL